MDSFYCGIEEKGVYSESAKTWQCILCDCLVIKSEHDRRVHASNPNHKRNVLRTLELLGKKYDHSDGRTILRRNSIVVDVERNADQVQCLHWKLQVQGILYRYMKLDTTCSVNEEASLLCQAETLIQKYEQMERLSLLELAVWKAACISRAGQVEPGSKTNIKTLHDAILFVANNRHTWKKYREEMRKSNAIEVIIQHVLRKLYR
jgi:hypothetical protein